VTVEVPATMHFEELDDETRRWMSEEFEREQAGPHAYRPRLLSGRGQEVFPDKVRAAIHGGTEVTLADALSDGSYWLAVDRRGRRVNVGHRAESLGLTEFNTWYVRGLSRRLLEERVEACEIYRAGEPRRAAAPECLRHEGQAHPVRLIYERHRRRYWPEPGDPTVLSIPSHPSCHHSIRRLPVRTRR
jgi:hypothetical protein